EYEAFVKTHEKFTAYGYIGGWTWITYGLIDDGIGGDLIGRDDKRLLFLSGSGRTPSDVAQARGSSVTGAELERLQPLARCESFPSQQPPHDSACESVCYAWTGDWICGQAFRQLSIPPHRNPG